MCYVISQVTRESVRLSQYTKFIEHKLQTCKILGSFGAPETNCHPPDRCGKSRCWLNRIQAQASHAGVGMLVASFISNFFLKTILIDQRNQVHQLNQHLTSIDQHGNHAGLCWFFPAGLHPLNSCNVQPRWHRCTGHVMRWRGHKSSLGNDDGGSF